MIRGWRASRLPPATICYGYARHIASAAPSDWKHTRLDCFRHLANTLDVNKESGIDRMKLVFLHGPPAVGKLAVARELARLTEYKLFHNHLTVDLVGSLFTFGSEPFVVLREKIWLSAFHEAATNNVSLVFTFNPENTVRGQFIQDALAVVENAGGELIFIELTCAEAELERRVVDPSRREFDKLRSVEQYRNLKAAGAFRFPSLPEGLSLDTTHRSPADTAKLISGHLSGSGE